jgi:putative oxidoreductase
MTSPIAHHPRGRGEWLRPDRDGLSILLGLFTQPVAFILAGEMAAACFMGHASRGFFPVNNGGDAVILYCFVFLFLMVAGAWTP